MYLALTIIASHDLIIMRSFITSNIIQSDTKQRAIIFDQDEKNKMLKVLSTIINYT